MSSVGWKTGHAGQTTITLTGLRLNFGKVREVRRGVSVQLTAWASRTARQLTCATVWPLVRDYLERALADSGPLLSRRLGRCHAKGIGQLRFMGSFVANNSQPFDNFGNRRIAFRQAAQMAAGLSVARERPACRTGRCGGQPGSVPRACCPAHKACGCPPCGKSRPVRRCRRT